MNTPSITVSDRDQIVAHVRSIFDAYFRRDREVIRRTHTADWTGFQLRSKRLVRGLDEYMRAANETLAHFTGVRYEFVDLEVQVIGDAAVVFYLAREWLRDTETGSERTILLRSVDVYRRDGGEWNQCGSNICWQPDDPV